MNLDKNAIVDSLNQPDMNPIKIAYRLLLDHRDFSRTKDQGKSIHR